MKKEKKKFFLELADKYRGSSSPKCSNFGDCGGCMFQDIAYENQLLLKRDYLNRLFREIHIFESVKPSVPYRYRNRMDFVTAFRKAGLRRSGNYRHVVDIESCDILQERADSVFKRVRPLLEEVEDYNYLKHCGYLRYVVLRQAWFTGEVMLNFVIADRENRLNRVIDAVHNEADSISILFNSGIADMSFGEVIEDVKGGTIEEAFDGVRFSIAPNSFFQSNSGIALSMYRLIKEKTIGKALDLYSGVGSISLFVAGACGHITGVEMQEEAVEMADRNMELNNITNADFVCADALRFLNENMDYYDTVILDPPRAGMHPGMIKHLKRIAPDRIIYMSCNPASCRRDLLELDEYKIDKFEAFDMFPQTPHIETLAVLNKKGS